jgi:Bifunctional DNA primase/polymerase, N-terminal/Primase C terminal 1 (PriCT-1)
MDNFKQIMKYVEMGIPVLPIHIPVGKGCSCSRSHLCDHIGKHPRMKGGAHNASADVAVVEGLREQYPISNWAIPTGESSGIVVIDVDGPEAIKSLAKFQPISTPTVKTSKGYHLYFEHPGGQIDNYVRILPQCDIRGDGGYIIVPPSLHKSGVRYQWMKGHALGEIKLQPLPSGLLEIIRTSERDVKKTRPDWGEKFSEKAAKGERNSHIVSLCGHLLCRDVDVIAVHSLMQGWNQMFCAPPLSGDEIEGIVISIAKREFDHNE